ncbi:MULTISPECIES: hypothetical protein [Veillonella]|nr:MULTISPECIES: hypothetical protein [Veillonella]
MQKNAKKMVLEYPRWNAQALVSADATVIMPRYNLTTVRRTG